MHTENLNRLRQYSKNIAMNELVINEVKYFLSNISHLIQIMNEDLVDRLHPSFMILNYSGLTNRNINTINDIIINGNIREQMTLIAGFSMNSCDIIWKILFMYHTNNKLINQISNIININTIKQKIIWIETNTQFKFSNLIKLCPSFNNCHIFLSKKYFSKYLSFIKLVSRRRNKFESSKLLWNKRFSI